MVRALIVAVTALSSISNTVDARLPSTATLGAPEPSIVTLVPMTKLFPLSRIVFPARLGAKSIVSPSDALASAWRSVHPGDVPGVHDPPMSSLLVTVNVLAACIGALSSSNANERDAAAAIETGNLTRMFFTLFKERKRLKSYHAHNFRVWFDEIYR